jgi:hypothetical protein
VADVRPPGHRGRRRLRHPPRPLARAGGSTAPYYTLLAACLLNLVYLILARTGVGLRPLARAQLSWTS